MFRSWSGDVIEGLATCIEPCSVQEEEQDTFDRPLYEFWRLIQLLRCNIILGLIGTVLQILKCQLTELNQV